ncbi:MAG TPA: hypothetical protein VFI65_30865 [Streptosporangiaceae bacterium]|nr:hypothetical protein [Streptosporangiaceae bacterium]
MTTGAFDRLLYTDCRAGQGRGAGGGFQVQAQSETVDAAQSKMAVGWLLYDVPNAWIVQGRPVGDFPQGFAHACEAGYGTAQTRYLGTEATGGRQGNHLADCLLTRDGGLYGPTRPAQLWGSELWRAEPWPDTDCPQLAETPPLGPLTVDAIADWLRAGPARPGTLTRLLSVLEQPGKRVVITADAPDEALRWIAAATLLLPIKAALEVSFKVFCSNHLRASHRVVAVPKDLNSQVAPGRGESAFVVDADADSSDEAAISERARFWVELLASVDDPYDVIDAIELASALSGDGGLGGSDAVVTAWAVTAPGSDLADRPALFRWLSDASEKLQSEYGGAVARRILAAEPFAAELRWIDAAVSAGNLEADGPVVRAMLLAAEIAEIRAGVEVPAGRLPRLNADSNTYRDADSEISSALLLANDHQVDRLLRLATRHRIVPQLPPLIGRLEEFTSGWLDSPGRDYSPVDWTRRDELLDLAYGQLRQRLAERGLREVMNALRKLWPHFANRHNDPADPLSCHLAMARMRATPAEDRHAQLAALIRQANRCQDRVAAFACLQSAVIDWTLLGPVESRQLLLALPSSVPAAPAVLDRVVNSLFRLENKPTARLLDLLHKLDERGAGQLADPFPALLAADRDLAAFVEATRDPAFGEDKDLARRWVDYLAEIEPEVVRARLRPLVRACLEYPKPDLGATVLLILPAAQQRLFVESWSRELPTEAALRATAWAYRWAHYSKLPGKLRSQILEAIKEFGASLSQEDLESWTVAVAGQIDSEAAEGWTRFVEREVIKPQSGRRGRGKDDGQ